MRWQPDAAACPECGYSWAQPVDEAVALVADLPARIDRAVVDPGAPAVRRAPAPGAWSQGAYVWHLVDVMSIGTERLWTISDDPGEGLRCWDENAFAEVREYERQSPVVGLRALRAAVHRWVDAAWAADPDATSAHDGGGTMTAADVIRRNAHEAVHHLLDISRMSADAG
ncbi:MAG: DinB family protein [Acidimicrobiales bacterium]